MKLDVKAMAITLAFFCGVLGMFLTAFGNLVSPGYGQAFLDVMASLYPGYDATPSLYNVVVGTLYGALDGAVVGGFVAWMYNRLARG